MTPRELLAVLIGAIAVWFIAMGGAGMLAAAFGGELSYLIVGGALLAIAGFVYGKIWQK